MPSFTRASNACTGREAGPRRTWPSTNEKMLPCAGHVTVGSASRRFNDAAIERRTLMRAPRGHGEDRVIGATDDQDGRLGDLDTDRLRLLQPFRLDRGGSSRSRPRTSSFLHEVATITRLCRVLSAGHSRSKGDRMDDMSVEIKALQAAPFFAGLSPEDIAGIVKVGQP